MDKHTNSDNPWGGRAWRAAGIAQGLAVLGVVAAGALWAASDARWRLDEPAPLATRATRPSFAPANPHGEGPAGWTIHLVGSEAEAQALRLVLAEGNNIRHDVGLSPLREEVLVVADAAEAARVAAAIDEGNLILAAFQVEDRVVNRVEA